MSSNFALINNDTVENVIYCESIEICQSIFPDKEIVDADNVTTAVRDTTSVGMSWLRIDGVFYPPMPEGITTSWHTGAESWLTQEEADQWQSWYDQDVRDGIIQP